MRSTLLTILLLGTGTGAAPAVAQSPLVPALLEPTFLLSVPRIVDGGAFGGDGAILGTTRELAIRDQSLTAPDRVFVPRTLRGRTLVIGDKVQFYRLGRTIVDPRTDERLGRLMTPTGIGTVDSLTDDVARVGLTHGFEPVLIGDYARGVEAGDTLAVVGIGAAGSVEGVVVASPEEQAILPPFELVFLRSTLPGELASGDRVLIDRPGETVSGRHLPDVPVARAMVVRVEERIAAAVLVETYRSDLTPGDRFHREASASE